VRTKLSEWTIDFHSAQIRELDLRRVGMCKLSPSSPSEKYARPENAKMRFTVNTNNDLRLEDNEQRRKDQERIMGQNDLLRLSNNMNETAKNAEVAKKIHWLC
jgi:hypothetical protein